MFLKVFMGVCRFFQRFYTVFYHVQLATFDAVQTDLFFQAPDSDVPGPRNKCCDMPACVQCVCVCVCVCVCMCVCGWVGGWWVGKIGVCMLGRGNL